MKTLRNVIILILLILIAASCGMPIKGDKSLYSGGTREFQVTNSAFAKYLDSYETEYANQNGLDSYKVRNIPVNFKDLPEYSGVCITYHLTGEKEILIDKGTWDRLHEGAKLSLIYHELGHCDLGRGHSDDEVEVGPRDNRFFVKRSIMAPIVPSLDENNYEGYSEELFQQNPYAVKDQLDKLYGRSDISKPVAIGGNL